MKLFLITTLIFIAQVAKSQNPSITDDTVVLKLTISDHESKKIETVVYIENTFNHHIASVKTNKEGKAECKVLSGNTYEVKIALSTDSYEYEVPEFAISPTEAELKFHLSAKNETLFGKDNLVKVGIRVLNNSNLKAISVSGNDMVKKDFALHNDTTYIPVQRNKNYTISVNGVAIANNILSIDEEVNPNYILCYYSDSKAQLLPIDDTKSLINIVYTDLYGKPVAGEALKITGVKSKFVYDLATTVNGSATIVVPQNEVYNISLKYYPNVFKLPIKPDTGKNVIVTNTVRLDFPSSNQVEQRKKLDSLRVVERDSFYAKYGKVSELDEGNFIKELEGKSKKVKIEVQKDPLYFAKENNTVCSVLYRNKDKWHSKIIITDVTGSMYPYMQQVSLWHMLEMMEKEKSDYVFFNDGDNMPDDKKVIGKTGGIYFSPRENPDSMVKTMYLAMQKGSGGDGAENDMEALLYAQGIKKNEAEIILVADNLSPVKDIALLSEMNLPVRVVLCGTRNTWINPDYLEIAYKTKGSIHTIEEDIYNLSMLHDEESVTLEGTLYVFRNGRFFQLDKRF